MKPQKIAICPTGGLVLPYIVDDMIQALVQLGHEVKYFPIRPPHYNFDYDLFLHFFTEFKPDFAFMLGINGIISLPGTETHFLEEQKIPYVSINFDFPYGLSKISKDQLSHLKAVFIWDKTYIPILQEKGINSVFHLPLATNPRRFRPRPAQDKEFDISFVGLISSPQSISAHKQQLPENLRDLANSTLFRYKNSNDNLIESIEHCHRLSGNPQKPSEIIFSPAFDVIDTTINMDYRVKIIQSLADSHMVHVFGNKFWEETITSNNLTVHPTVSYNKDLPVIYNSSKVNLNLTTPQLITTINQRIFDAGVTNNFIVTDYRPALTELFDPDEIVYFKNENELIEITDRYLTDEPARKAVSTRLFARILAEHTWVHRMKTVIEVLSGL